ncbi:ccaat-box dna-binding subunit related protein [Cystoisospora suis]|uniref:Ccaat-box dna-binding subunit related protein n=1 Tax=Cystoisospora suis TaxID=483139 RepID=A0A2C6KFJ8_9APIC|nr:ccaat-box dna-binding subunit related protein [Cystoisospora suis]
MSSSNRGEDRGGGENGGEEGEEGKMQQLHIRRRMKGYHPHHQRLQLFKEGGKCTLAPFSDITETRIDKENPIDPYFL